MSESESKKFWVESGEDKIYGASPEEAINAARKRIVAAKLMPDP